MNQAPSEHPSIFSMKPVAHIHAPFGSKFGIPRQSGLTPLIHSVIVLENEFHQEGILRGLEGFSHLWMIWYFSESACHPWMPMVRPPRLGGNQRVGVFASRSPFRPNPIGLSCVKMESIQDYTITVSGADLMDGTPILDIKPYIPYADSISDALGGFTKTPWHTLQVDIPTDIQRAIPADLLSGLMEVLSHDPRPSYQNDPDRVYGFPFADWDVKFTVIDQTLRVVALVPLA